MDILHVTQPAVDGVANIVAELSKAQSRHGLDVGVAYPMGTGTLDSMLVESNVKRINWEAQRSPFKGLRSERTQLKSIVTQHKPKILHLHSAKAGLVGRLIPAKSHVIYQPHAWSFWATDGGLRRACIAWESAASKWTNTNIYVCEEELLEGHRYSIKPENEITIPNGIDTEHFSPANQTASRETLSLPQNKIIFLCLGRVCKQKGQDVLLDFWPKLREAFPDSILLFVGDGPDKDQLEKKDHDGVIWRQAAPSAEYYRAANLVIVPSRWEVIGLVTMEAMSCGTPVITSDFAGARYALGDDKFICNFHNHDESAAKIRAILANEEYASQIGRSLRQRAVSLHSSRISTNKHISILENILATPGRFTRNKKGSLEQRIATHEIRGTSNQDRWQEVKDSLQHAGQRNTNNQSASAAMGMVLLNSAKGREHQNICNSDHTMLVVSNPKRQGSKVVRALQATEHNFFTVADCNRTDDSWRVDWDFPGPSTRRAADIARLTDEKRESSRWVIQHAIANKHTFPGLSIPMIAFLLQAQLTRYDAALKFLEGSKCNFVLTDFDRSIYSRPFVDAAKALEIPTATLVHGTPNDNYIPLLADQILTWGEVQRSWFSNKGAKAKCVGRMDLQQPPKSAGDQIDRVIIAHSRETLHNDEQEMLIQAQKTLHKENISTTVRVHPSTDRVDHTWKTVCEVANYVDATPGSLIDKMIKGDAVIGVQSTAIIDAMAAGFPSSCLASPNRSLPADLQALKKVDFRDWNRSRWVLPKQLESIISSYGNQAAENVISHIEEHSKSL